MAECVECGKKLGFLEAGVGGLCSNCAFLGSITPDDANRMEQGQRDWRLQQEQSDANQALQIQDPLICYHVKSRGTEVEWGLMRNVISRQRNVERLIPIKTTFRAMF